MGGSSSQPRTNPPRSPINAFPIEELYTPEFLESLQENTAYWHQPNAYEAVGDQVVTSPMKKKKAARNRQKGRFKAMMHPDGLCGQLRKKLRWLKVGGPFMKTASMESGAGDEDYVQKAMIHYEHETGVPFRYRHCWDVLKDKSGDASIHLNTTVSDEDEVQEIRRPGGRDKARAAAKNKRSKALGSSTINDNALARLMVNEMTAAEIEQRDAFMELKMREVECREREITATKYRAQQEDIKLYLLPYDHLTGEQRLAMDEIRAKIKATYNLQY
ncbi:hypothetical protein Tco_0652886 [Tanacetum coccineum]|uniref:No apical meristem-associated C-terminal domain-containing protein n=1 Tax=Tanacetum coccineum TaxID=301880 RepID=A0ABQ4WZ16_9ASTR